MPRRSSGLFVLLVVVDFGELGVNDVVLLAFGRSSIAGGLLGGLLVHRFAKLHRSLGERVGLGSDRIRIAALQRFLEVGNGVFNRTAVSLTDLRAVFGHRLFGRMDKRLGVVLRLDLRFALLVFLGVSLGVLDHLLDVGLGKTAGSLDADLLLLAGAFVLR